ncbi:hypothetical protein [Salipiger sp.]|uniref:hypothetical protein n=1 Tax=Salipiger sp. TaxID=2078585 RepID=UPI003A984BC3
MKRLIFLLAAAVTVAGAAQAARNHGRIDQTPVAERASGTSGERLAMSMGRPNALTTGEQQEVVFLLPGTDPTTIPPEKWGRVRAIIHGDYSDAQKKTDLRLLLRR